MLKLGIKTDFQDGFRVFGLNLEIIFRNPNSPY